MVIKQYISLNISKLTLFRDVLNWTHPHFSYDTKYMTLKMSSQINMTFEPWDRSTVHWNQIVTSS